MSVIMQAQVPTTPNDPPRLTQGRNPYPYLNVSMTGGNAVQLVPSRGFVWAEVEDNHSSATPGIINYWLTTELTETNGEIVLQAQVPTTEDRPPVLGEHRGQQYFSIPTTNGPTLMLLPSRGFHWTRCEDNHSSATPGIINYWLFGQLI